MFDKVLQAVIDRIHSTGAVTAGLLLITAFGSALFAYVRTVEKHSFREFFEFMIPHEVIWHPSARADFLFYVTRRAILPFLMIPAGMTFIAGVGYGTRLLLETVLQTQAPLLNGPPGPITVVFFTGTMLLAYDLSYYIYHVAQHRIPFLWELHKVHHSAEVLVGITKDRVHPLDDFMNRAWDGVIPGICFGIWSLLMFDLTELTIFGINVYVMRNILMMDFVRHTHFKISFGWLNHVVLCPHWHQLHHSANPKHYDKNFGLLFSFWDRVFGSQCVPEPDETFKFGLMDKDADSYQSLFGLYVLPLKKMWRLAVSWLKLVAGVSTPQDRAS